MQNEIDIFAKVKSERSTFESHWQECADYALPRKNTITGVSEGGSKRMSRIYDSTAIMANEELASSLGAMLTNPSSIWFSLILTDRELMMLDPVRLWLDHATRKMHNVLNASNFYTEIPEVYLDLGCFGTADLFISDDIEKIVKFKTYAMADIYLVENAAGEVIKIYRKFFLRLFEAKEQFGDKLPEMYKRKKDDMEKVEFLQVIQHRKKFDPNRADPKNMPVESSFWTIKDKTKILESGYREWPVPTPRWTKTNDEAYGRSCTMKALPDIKMINEMSKTILKAGQKSADPPLIVNHKEMYLPLRTFPGGINYSKPSLSGRDPITHLQSGANFPLSLELEERRRKAIKEAYFLDDLSLPDVKTHVSVPEFTARNQERLRKLGPILGRLQQELLRPIIDRVFGIMLWKGLFLPPPEILAGHILDVEYVSPIASAQRMEEANSLMRALSSVGPLLETNPEILDNIEIGTYLV